MFHKRLTLFAGHYGSGKTNIALNYARRLKQEYNKVAIADLDIVNPYFRTKDSEAALKAEGIDLIVSEYANSNVDLPSMPKEIYWLMDSTDTLGVLDIGGDDRGALALGRYVPSILEENDYEMLAVINQSRPLTNNVRDTIEVLAEIENACRMNFTGIVNNTNLGLQTTVQDVLDSLRYADEVSKVSGLPIRMTCADEKLCPELEGKVPDLFPLKLQKLYYMLNTEALYGKDDI